MSIERRSRVKEKVTAAVTATAIFVPAASINSAEKNYDVTSGPVIQEQIRSMGLDLGDVFSGKAIIKKKNAFDPPRPLAGGEWNTSVEANKISVGKQVLIWAQKIVNSLEKGEQGLYNRLWVDKNKDGNPDLSVIQNNGYSATMRDGYYRDLTNQEDAWKEQYWCTYLVADAMGLAGNKDLYLDMDWKPEKGTPNHKGVAGMHNWWMSEDAAKRGYKHIEYQFAQSRIDALRKVHPGYAMFMETSYSKLEDGKTRAVSSDGREHVALVESISLNPDGSGKLVTIDANSVAKRKTYTILEGGQISGQYTYTAKDSNDGVAGSRTSYPVNGFGAPPSVKR